MTFTQFKIVEALTPLGGAVSLGKAYKHSKYGALFFIQPEDPIPIPSIPLTSIYRWFITTFTPIKVLDTLHLSGSEYYSKLNTFMILNIHSFYHSMTCGVTFLK